MAVLDDALAAIATLDADVKLLIASLAPPVDLQPAVDAVNAVDAEVKAATPPPSPPPPPAPTGATEVGAPPPGQPEATTGPNAVLP